MDWKKLLNKKRLRLSTRETDARNEFESDFGRVIFSPAIRRMHDKTQVFPLTSDDNIHSRLTHSMEVMSIGHSLGVRICEEEKFKEIVGDLEGRDLLREIPIILQNACLVHDIGNPPFGHFGESVIQNYFKTFFNNNDKIQLSEMEKGDFINFDGNAQGFRVLTKIQVLDDVYGLNLTYATLASYTKYPNSGNLNKDNISTKKRGVFQSEVEYLNKIADECALKNEKGIIVRHPLCYLMEAADSICYSIMDIEDGFNIGLYKYSDITSYLTNIPGISSIIGKIEKENIKAKEEAVEKEPSDATKMVKFRIALIKRLVDLAVNNFVNNIESIYAGTYNKELIYDDSSNLAKTLGDFCVEKIFPSRAITSLELTGHSVLSGLLDYYTNFVFHTDKAYRKRAQSLISNSVLKIAYLENDLEEKDWSINNLSDYYKLRVIVDFISGMTDQFALKHYQELSGQKIK